MSFLLRAAVARRDSLAAFRARPELRKATEQMLWAFAAASSCLEGVEYRESLGLVVGSSQGELETTKEYFRAYGREGVARPFLFQNSLHHSTAGMLSQLFGIRGAAATVSDAFFSGESALELAGSFLASGQCERCVVVGVDTLVPDLAPGVRARYPEGFVPGEGAAAVLLSSTSTGALAEIEAITFKKGAAALPPAGFYDADAIERLARSSLAGELSLPKPDGSSSRLRLRRLA
jgi:3-oxoacyl-(acyl-carrier-protein) synthase